MVDKGPVVFCGTPNFAVESLQALIRADYPVELVITRPDKPKGRGRKTVPPPVKIAADKASIAVEQPAVLRQSQSVIQRIEKIDPQFIVVVAYGQLIPRDLLDMPQLGTINVHASLLPQYRGADPITRAMLDGREVTGITTMLLDEGMDTGPILQKRTLEIGQRENTGQLRDRMAVAGAQLLIETLDGLRDQTITPRPQDDAEATYAEKLTKEETIIDWTQPAQTLVRRVLALSPKPGASAKLPDGRRIKIFDAQTADGTGKPGEVLSCKNNILVVATGEGALQINEVQCEGKKKMEAGAFLCGANVCPGQQFE